jgi:anti-sigma factor (TIGR02949 family)
MTCDEAQELITALADQELFGPERSSLEAHLEECARCRLALDKERALKQAIREAGRGIHAPSQLRAKILADRRVFPENRRWVGKWWDYLWPAPHLARAALAIALLSAVVLPTFVLLQSRSEPIAFAALQTYDLFLKGELPAQRAKPHEIVEQLTRTVGGRFHPMGYDLTAMDLRPVAGLVREIQGRKILVAIYQGQGGTLFCYTFLGSEVDAPPNAARFFDAAKKMNFYAFSRGNVNAVFHREGEVICIMASEMPMDALLALARSKAKPS